MDIATNYPAPEKTLTLKVDDAEREVFMSYGLQDQLLRLVKDTNEIGTLFIDAEVRNAVIEQVLAERTKTGKITTKKAFDEYDIEIEEVDKILSWVADHITHFFIKVLSNLGRRLDQSETNDSQSTPQPNGSKA